VLVADRSPGSSCADAVRGRPHLPRLQFISASLYSLGHGGNDAQKTMGIIAVLLFSQG
jgi:phosphate/sulfate permease